LHDSEQNAVTRAGGQGLRLEDRETWQGQLHHVGHIAGGEINLVDSIIRWNAPTVGDPVNDFRHGRGRGRCGAGSSARQEERSGCEQDERRLFYGSDRADFLAQRA
jgi:hypothetical protein